MVPHRLYIDLYRDRFEGWWVLADGSRLSDAPTRFAPNATNLLAAPDGARAMFKIPAGDVEWVQAVYLPREDGVFSVALKVLAVDAGQERAAKRLAAVKVMRGAWQ
ncbi:MAG: hypothetical protein K2X82_07010 [Gemmataceae bacterium]|nr:hypothetical protein [Gemmataceae bacterium]